MTYNMTYTPFTEKKRKGFYDVFTTVNYSMFPEMAEEFSAEDYPSEYEIQLEGTEDENENWTYNYDLELPYGEVKCQFKYRLRKKNEEDNEEPIEEMPPIELEQTRAKLEPVPVSIDQQRINDINEEEDNKKKEHE